MLTSRIRREAIFAEKKAMGISLSKRIGTAAAMCLAAAVSLSCENFGAGEEKGTLSIRFDKSSLPTKANLELPDRDDFLISVKDGGGESVFDGRFGDMPEDLAVDPGTYDISVRSRTFKKPEFSAPVFGDDQSVIVPSGGRKDVVLLCTQINSGVRLRMGSDFLEAYPDGVLFLKSSDGKLMYSHTEKRIAYFNPGTVSLTMDNSGETENLLTRSLEPREILSVKIAAPYGSEGGSGKITVSVDTSRTWTGADLTIGDDSQDGGDSESAVEVSQAREMAGSEGVWVRGYIVGAFKSTNHPVFEAPFPSSTNLVIAAKTSETDKAKCLSVELKRGDMRDLLNLVDNPDNEGRRVFLKGDVVEAYYGIPGLKNITDYELE